MGDERGKWVPTRGLETSNPCSGHEVLLSIYARITANTAGTITASSINNLFISATGRKFILITTTTTTTVRISTSVIVKARERGRSTLKVLNPIGG